MDAKNDANSQTSPSERRKSPRRSVDFEVEIVAVDGNAFDESPKGQAVNISRNGLCLTTPFSVPISTLLSLSISFAGRDSHFLGEIVWKKDHGDGAMYGLHIKRWSYLDPLLDREITPELTPHRKLSFLSAWYHTPVSA